jgi:hypothetical protein
LSNIIEHIEELLKRDWSEEDRKIITDLLANIKYYKKFIPKAVIEDVNKAVNLCIRIKDEHTLLLNNSESNLN